MAIGVLSSSIEARDIDRYVQRRVFHIDRSHIQTMMYLKLSVAGHLTIFLTRTRGPFWSIRPAKILLIAVFSTQALATLMAVYGIFMTPLGWGWAGFVWGYALVWFLINDRIKLLAYHIFDKTKANPKIAAQAGEANPDSKTNVPKTEGEKGESMVDTKTADPQTDAKAADPKSDTKADGALPDAKAATAQPDAKATSAQPDPKPTDAKPEATDKAQSDKKAELIKKVHKLYEELGREDVREVEALEAVQKTGQKDEK